VDAASLSLSYFFRILIATSCRTRKDTEYEDAHSKGPRNGVEMSFDNIVCMFTDMDYFPNHRIFQSGRSTWPYLHCLWDLQVLFFNLFTCAEGLGNHINGMFCISPSRVSEYLYSTSHNLLVNSSRNEVDNFGDEPEGNCM